MKDKTILRIYQDKNGEIDFGVSNIKDWDIAKQKEIRSMIITAIYVLEDLWRSNNNIDINNKQL